MTLAELLPGLQQLSHEDKRRAVKFLIQEIAREEDALTLIEPDAESNWSHYNADDAAQVLWEALQEDKHRKLG